MKLVLLAALAALMNAQAPVAAKPDSTAPTVLNQKAAERTPSKEEILEYRATLAEIKNLRVQFRIDDFNQKISPKVAEQQKLFTEMCRSVGVPEEKINPPAPEKSQCGLNMGLDDDGNPLRDATGKPVAPKVWWEKPAPAPPAAN